MSDTLQGRRLVAAGLTALMAAAMGACSSGGPDHGKIVGDAYIAPELDRVIDLPGMTIHLVEEVEEMDSTLSRTCPYPERRLARAREADSAAIGNAWVTRDRFLTGIIRRTVRSNPQAQFVIDSVQPGRYRLWADTVVGEKRWNWLQRVRIRAGDSTRVNLSNANADEDPLRCYMIPGSDGFLFR